MTFSSTEGHPRVLVAPDSFKGCLASVDVCQALASGIQIYGPELRVQRLPMADGGEGTLAAVAAACPGVVLERQPVRGPDGAGVDASILWLPERRTAVIELAEAAGLALVPTDDPSNASTWGVGELIAAALAQGAKRVLVGAGGSGTVDGGAGALQALGFSLLDSAGTPIGPGIYGLEAVRTLHVPDTVPVGVEILCDVQSPLLGERGAARLYGPQKGATPEMVERAELALERFAGLIKESTGRDPRTQNGAGAAGGFAGGMWAALGATLCSGFQGVAELVDLERRIKEVDWVVTGEGRVDGQTGEGKLVAGVQSLCAAAGVPLFVVAGQATPAGRAWCEAEGVKLLELGDGEPSVTERIDHAAEFLKAAGGQIAELL